MERIFWLWLLLGCTTTSLAALHQDSRNQHQASFTLDGTKIRIELHEGEHRLTERVLLKGHARAGFNRIELKLHPAWEITCLKDAGGPLEFHRSDENLEIVFPHPFRAGERFHIVFDMEAHLFDQARGPGPHRNRAIGQGFSVHLDPKSGLVLPREAYWYPRPAWADPQEISLQISMPRTWRLMGKLYKEHDLRVASKRRLIRASTQGVIPRPLGLAAGPYEETTLHQNSLQVRLFHYPPELAEHPDVTTTRRQRVEEILAYLTQNFGAPGRGRLDFIELAGASIGKELPTFLSQGAFAWIQNPRGQIEPVETFLLARELSRGWWERKVRMSSAERGALIHFVALLTVRHIHGESEFLKLCREAGRAHGAAPLPGPRLLAYPLGEWEYGRQVPDGEISRRQQVLLLLSYLQRLREQKVLTALSRFSEAYDGRIAHFAEFLDLLDKEEWQRTHREGKEEASG